MRGAAAHRQGKGGYSFPFYGAYFFYYAGYSVFSSFIVLYLTHRGLDAAQCGWITSLTLAANLLMEPFGGYIVDTFLSHRQYLTLSIGAVAVLCLLCTFFMGEPLFCVAALILTAGIAYPFSQLMDAWVSCSREMDGRLIYSRVRAAGSVGYALSSLAMGWYFQRFGWELYFFIQAALFAAMIPFLGRLPVIPLGNRRKTAEEKNLSLGDSFRVLLGNRRFLICLLVITVYWFGHRPVGSYLSLLVAGRGGGSGDFGTICAVGALLECGALLLISARQRRGRLSFQRCMAAAMASTVLRPLLMALLPGLWPVYVGHLMQSLSFSFYYAGSMDWFARVADPRLRNFCISMGLTVSSVVGTVSANLLGGWLYEWGGVDSVIRLSLGLSIAACGLFFLSYRYVFPRKER